VKAAAPSAKKSNVLAHEIVSTLKKRILSWEYPPLHRLTEETLCSEFSVSRSPVREALRVLQTDGYLTRMTNRGFVVRQLDLREIEELYQTRFALELYAIQIVAERGAPPGTVAALKKTWKAVRADPLRSAEELANLDVEFHEALAGLLGNRMLDRQLKEINARLFAFRLVDFGKADRVVTSCKEHLKVLELLAAGNAQEARTALMINIEGSRSTARLALMEAVSRSYANA
jgi:DNA-binding GntR family transcriptional regulator